MSVAPNITLKTSIKTETYDTLGRLIQVEKDNTVVEEYSYDNNGNRQSATVNNETITASYTLDDNLVVYGDNSYSYDEDGYLKTKTTPDGATSYDYGTLGELLSVSTPTKTISYKHNANSQRVAKLVNGVITEKYLWANLTTLLAIYDSNDNLVQRFEYADQRMPVTMTMGATKYYLHYDQVGSLRAVSDSSHNIIKEVVYDTFGNILNDSNPSFRVPFGFAGGLYDSDTKLTRFGYRDYDAYTGKWTAKDPIGFQGGDSNLYGYVLGDPVNFVDPTGELAWLIPVGIYFVLGDQWLLAPTDESELNPDLGNTPMTDLGLCILGPKYLKSNTHGPHQGLGPHLHWGKPRKLLDSTQVPLKWHFGPRNPNHGLPKGQNGWSWKDWWNNGRPIRWK